MRQLEKRQVLRTLTDENSVPIDTHRLNNTYNNNTHTYSIIKSMGILNSIVLFCVCTRFSYLSVQHKKATQALNKVAG